MSEVGDKLKNYINEYIMNHGLICQKNFMESDDEYYTRMFFYISHQNTLKERHYMCLERHDDRQMFNYKHSGPYGGKICEKCNKFFR